MYQNFPITLMSSLYMYTVVIAVQWPFSHNTASFNNIFKKHIFLLETCLRVHAVVPNFARNPVPPATTTTTGGDNPFYGSDFLLRQQPATYPTLGGIVGQLRKKSPQMSKSDCVLLLDTIRWRIKPRVTTRDILVGGILLEMSSQFY